LYKERKYKDVRENKSGIERKISVVRIIIDDKSFLRLVVMMSMEYSDYKQGWGINMKPEICDIV